jgi:hypothetical protein
MAFFIFSAGLVSGRACTLVSKPAPCTGPRENVKVIARQERPKEDNVMRAGIKVRKQTTAYVPSEHKPSSRIMNSFGKECKI